MFNAQAANSLKTASLLLVPYISDPSFFSSVFKTALSAFLEIDVKIMFRSYFRMTKKPKKKHGFSPPLISTYMLAYKWPKLPFSHKSHKSYNYYMYIQVPATYKCAAPCHGAF